MPELPEVETTRAGIEPHLVHKKVVKVIVRHPKLRWPVPSKLESYLKDQVIKSVERRGKYILVNNKNGTLIIHLGMSGSLRILDKDIPAEKHDHVDIILGNGKALRFRDPRRFGCILWTDSDPLEHSLLKSLGPEPLSKEFNTGYLFNRSRKRSVTIKQFIMDSKVVVGVGNIYASEALFMSGIHPKRSAGKISEERYDKLVKAIKKVLKHAIKQGGTTLRDFTNSEGKPGYFKQKLFVYDRAGEPCLKCQTPIKQITQGQRSSYYCPHCQK